MPFRQMPQNTPPQDAPQPARESVPAKKPAAQPSDPPRQPKPLPDFLDAQSRRVYAFLSTRNGADASQICDGLRLDISQVFAALTMLELAGAVRKDSHKTYFPV